MTLCIPFDSLKKMCSLKSFKYKSFLLGTLIMNTPRKFTNKWFGLYKVQYHLSNNTCLLVIIDKFDPNPILMNVDKLKSYNYVSKEVQGQTIITPIYWDNKTNNITIGKQFVDDEDNFEEDGELTYNHYVVTKPLVLVMDVAHVQIMMRPSRVQCKSSMQMIIVMILLKQ